MNAEEKERAQRQVLTALGVHLRQHADQIARITCKRKVAVVVHEPRFDGATGAAMAEALASLGWDGETPVFEMSSKTQRRVALALKSDGDGVSHDWLMSGRYGRVVIFSGLGTLLVNWNQRTHKWGFEPGSLDREYLS